ncbi:hypothetical protein [Xanthomonas phage SB3]|uniref:Uncharacterized protein n=1 Tax=Xanthomonas phage SB3 TaxID=3117472 RepID=A0ABZ2GYD8_9CAUD
MADKVVAFPFKHGVAVKVKTAGGGLAVGDTGVVIIQYQEPTADAKWVAIVRVPIATYGNHDFHILSDSLELAV